jgi:hypothetical protein
MVGQAVVGQTMVGQAMVVVEAVAMGRSRVPRRARLPRRPWSSWSSWIPRNTRIPRNTWIPRNPRQSGLPWGYRIIRRLGRRQRFLSVPTES